MTLEKTWRWFGADDLIKLSDLRQMGIEGVVTALNHIPSGEVWSVEEIEKRRNMIEEAGMRWSVVESLPVSETIKMRGEDCERHIENYKISLRNLGKCGVTTVCYNFMPVLDWARTSLSYKHEDGTDSMFFDYTIFAAFDVYILQRPGSEKDYSEEVLAKAKKLVDNMTEKEKDEVVYNVVVATQAFVGSGVGNVPNYKEEFQKLLDNYKDIDKEQLRSNLKHFLEEVIPVAEEAGVNLCIHPDDPPFPLLGLPRIASTLEDYEWIINQVDSVANGVTFCTGSLSVREDNVLLNFIKNLAPRIHFIHLRNITRNGERTFYESGHIDGVLDMPSLVQALLEEQIRRKEEGRKDYRIAFRPDHGLRMLHDFEEKHNPGYPLIGRLKGLAEISGIEAGILYCMKNNKN